VCADYRALKSSLAALANVNVLSSGVDGLRAALDDVSAKASTFAASSKEFATEADSIQQALTALRTTLGDLPSGGVQAVLTTLHAQIIAVANAGTALNARITGTCPDPSSSP
jgi:ABC-type transporter Mla subunit MlaD